MRGADDLELLAARRPGPDGAVERALEGTPVIDPAQPLERTVCGRSIRACLRGALSQGRRIASETRVHPGRLVAP